VVKEESIAQMEPQSRELEVVNRLLRACDDNVKTGARPSVEAHLHAWLDKCVIHLHPSAAGAYVNARNGKAKLEKLFKTETLPPLWVPYTDPGYMLARRIARLVEAYQAQYGKTPGILFLEKHGLFITADSAGGALRLVRRVIKQCNSKLKQPKTGKLRPVSQKLIDDVKSCIERGYSEGTGEKATIWYYYNTAIEGFCRQEDSKKMLSGSLMDLRCGWRCKRTRNLVPGPRRRNAIRTVLRSASDGRLRAAESLPLRFWSRALGSLSPGPRRSPRLCGTSCCIRFSFGQMRCGWVEFARIFIRTNAVRMGGIRTLNKRQEDFISNWESEAFRKKLASEKN
jgi:hypothetical protein